MTFSLALSLLKLPNKTNSQNEIIRMSTDKRGTTFVKINKEKTLTFLKHIDNGSEE